VAHARKKPVSQESDPVVWAREFYAQTAIWWGRDPQGSKVHGIRLDALERLCGKDKKRVLDLGAGPCGTAAAMADAGHDVVAVELNPKDIEYARKLCKVRRKGVLELVEGDFYKVKLKGRFNAVCCWEAFGLGSDADQRRLLRRISREWLAPGGSALIEVYSPIGPMRNAGKEVRLQPLKGVPGSVEMFNRCLFDPASSRWTDEWIPVKNPSEARAQSIRCYSPADFEMLLDGTGLKLLSAELDGREIKPGAGKIGAKSPLMDTSRTYAYLAKLVRSD